MAFSCGPAERPFLSALEAGKGYPLYTTYAAVPERSNFVLDEGYAFQYDTDSLGADFTTDTGGDIALGFKRGDKWVYRTQDMYRPPIITASYPDMVRYTYQPFEDVRVDAWFVVHSSTMALLDVQVTNLGDSAIALEVYPFMRNDRRAFQHIVQHRDHLLFDHQEYPDSWTLDHGLPYTDSIRNVWMTSEMPTAVGAFTSESGEPFNLPNPVENSRKPALQINGRAYLPGKQRLGNTGSKLRLQLTVDGDPRKLLTENSPVWGGMHQAIDQGGFYRLEAAMLSGNARTFTVQAFDETSGLAGRISGELAGASQRHDIDLSPAAQPPVMGHVKLQQYPQHHIELSWQAAQGQRLFSIYRRHYPAPHYERIATGIAGATYTDTTAAPGQVYGYLVVPLGENGQLGIHAPEVNTVGQTVFMEFVGRGIGGIREDGVSYAKVVAFKHAWQLDGGATKSLRFIRGVAPIGAPADSLVQAARGLLDRPLDPYQQDNERFFAKTPVPQFDDRDKEALYWSAVNMMRQVFYPPEGKSSYNYYVFSREPTWGWGHGGQVFHESIAMLAYADVDPVGAMNSQRVYLERQYPNGYINYRTGSYLDEVIEHNGQLTTSAPWYAWLNWEIYRITRDTVFLREMYGSSAKLFRFIVDNRDSDGDGLCEWGGHAVLESVRDALVAVWDEVGFPTNFESLDLNCMLVKEAKSLEQMALALGLETEAAAWRADHERRTQLINETFWDEANGFYYQVDKDTHTFSHKAENDLKRDEIIGFLPLWAGVADKQRVARLVEKLTDSTQFWREYGVPTLSARDSYYNDKGYWNGPVWVQWNYLIMLGLQDYGYHDEARELVDRVANGMIAVLKDTHNLWEFYSPDEPWGGYHKTYIWAGIINRMMLDVRQ